MLETDEHIGESPVKMHVNIDAQGIPGTARKPYHRRRERRVGTVLPGSSLAL